MDSTLVLIVFQITAAICYSYHNLDDGEYFGSPFSLTDIAGRLTPREPIETDTSQGTRVLKLIPFTENKNWKNKVVPVPPEVNEYNDIPIAVIIAANKKIKDKINKKNLAVKGDGSNFGYNIDYFENSVKNDSQPSLIQNVEYTDEYNKHDVSEIDHFYDGRKKEPLNYAEKQNLTKIKENSDNLKTIVTNDNTIDLRENETKIVENIEYRQVSGKDIENTKKVTGNKSKDNKTKIKITGEESTFKPKPEAVANETIVQENKEEAAKNIKDASNKTATNEHLIGNKDLLVEIKSKGETGYSISKCGTVPCVNKPVGPNEKPNANTLQKIYNLSFIFNK